MAKKVRFPLEMENKVQVRSMEELRDNFSLVRVLEYLKNGKLIIWLQQRYATDIAEEIEKLDLQDSDLGKKVCQIFDVPYDETAEEELEKAVERVERIKKLREYTDDREYEKVVDNVAFDQDELYDLLDEDAETIYLCGNRFSIPLAKEGISYIGINEPTVVIDSKEEVNWNEKNISVENVVFDSKYQEVLDSANKVKETKREVIGNYSNDSDVNFMLSASEKKEAENMYRIAQREFVPYMDFMFSVSERRETENMYQLAQKELGEIIYDIDADIKGFKKLAEENGIINLAQSYIEQL